MWGRGRKGEYRMNPVIAKYDVRLAVGMVYFITKTY